MICLGCMKPVRLIISVGARHALPLLLASLIIQQAAWAQGDLLRARAFVERDPAAADGSNSLSLTPTSDSKIIYDEVKNILFHNYARFIAREITEKYKLHTRRWKRKTIPLSTLFRDNPELPAWEQEARQDVERYSKEPASAFPPVIVIIDQNKHVLLDGSRRTNAAKKRGDEVIMAYVGDLPADGKGNVSSPMPGVPQLPAAAAALASI